MNIYQLSSPAIHDPAPFEIVQELALLEHVPANVAQSIRAFRVVALQDEARRIGHHFLYVHCASAATRQQVLTCIADAFHLPPTLCKTVQGLAACLTRQIFQAGVQSGFVVVLEQLPNTPHFDREARETLLDVFRDAADFWAGKKVPFRTFYSFS